MRTVATIKNTIWAFAQQLIICILGFVTRKLMLDTIGVQGVGLNGLFTNVLTLLTLAELGVGSAIIYNMFEPIARGDKQAICRLMNFYKLAYRVIAVVIAIIGLAIIPFLQYIINDVDYDYTYIVIVYLLFLAQTVTSYFFAYQRSMLTANQNQYISTAIDIAFKIVSSFIGIAILYLTKDFIIYLSVSIILGVINNICVAAKVYKIYPYLKGKEMLAKEDRKPIYKNIKDIFIGKLSWRVTSSTDNILISIIVGTVDVGLLSNYSMIITTLTSIVDQFMVSMTGSVGNLLVEESKEYIEMVLHRLTFMMFMLGSFCSVCLFALLTPFVSMFFGEEYIIPLSIVSVIVINFYLCTVRAPLWKMISVSGLFAKDKYISLAGTVINLIISLAIGIPFGMFGILLGTTSTIVIQYVLKIVLFYKSFLHRSYVKEYIELFVYFGITAVESVAAYYIGSIIIIPNAFLGFVIKMIIAAVIPIVINYLLFRKKDDFQYFKELALKTIKRKKA